MAVAGAWFAKDEGDGATARVLLPGPLDGSGVAATADPKQPRCYKLEVRCMVLCCTFSRLRANDRLNFM
jgi:hypothetical protein